MSNLNKSATVPLNKLLDADLDKIIKSFMHSANVPGVSLAVHQHGDSSHPKDTQVRSYGHAYDDAPVTLNTRFPIGSISKHFLSLALLRLLYNKGMNEDTPIRDVLPDFRLSNEGIAGGVVTFGHLLSHTTGMRPNNAAWFEVHARGVSIFDYLAELPCADPPGNKFYYANVGYDLCVPAIEQLSGERIQEHLDRVFFRPLGMLETNFSGEGCVDAAEGSMVCQNEDGTEAMAVTVPFGKNFGGQAAPGLMWMGAAGIISSAKDMAIWAEYLPTDPFYDLITTPRIPSYDPYRPGHSVLPESEQYGLGMFVGEYKGVPYVEQWAGMGGFAGHMTVLSSLGLSVVSFCNSWDGREMGNMIVAALICRVLGEDTQGVIDSMTQERRQRIKEESDDFPPVPGTIPDPADQILGSFTNPGMGKMTFTSDSYIDTRPRCSAIPWIPWLYGDVKPLLTYLGAGRYAGCLEYRQWGRDGQVGNSVRYGYPFRLDRAEEGMKVVLTGEWFEGPLALTHTCT